MDFSVIFVSVLSWDFLAYVNARFYLETTNKDKARLYNVILYECNFIEQDFGVFEVKCKRIWWPHQKQRIYSVANFNSVEDLELLMGHLIEIDGKRMTGKLPPVLALGIEPKTFRGKPGFFKPACENTLLIESKVTRLLSRFVDSVTKVGLKPLLEYLSLNNIAWFFSWTTQPAELFASFADTLEKVIKTAECLRKEEPKIVPQKWTCTANALRYIPWSWFRSQAQSPAPTKSVTRYYQHKHKSQPQPQSQPQFPPQSPSQTSYDSVSQYSSESESEGASKRDIMRAVGLLAFKMFDPCFVLFIGHEEIALAESVCTTYCRFHSMTIKVYSRSFAPQCENLTKGQCTDRACICVPSSADKSKSVRMVVCNNALRLLIYQQAVKNRNN